MADKAPTPQFTLTAPHYYQDQYLDTGTIVGKGTTWPDIPVSLNMEGRDEDADEIVKKHRDRKIPNEFGEYEPPAVSGSPTQLPTGKRPNTTSLPT